MPNNLVLAPQKIYDKLDVGEDLNEDFSQCELSALLSFYSPWKNEDVKEAIILSQKSLASLPSLRPDSDGLATDVYIQH
ncbi:hypothetical protein BDR07DRAFT_1495031 [Suillus spraguei]|nr:hypothetical protein BDR07DRAFT_1495031 [Suillus spraguei]